MVSDEVQAVMNLPKHQLLLPPDAVQSQSQIILYEESHVIMELTPRHFVHASVMPSFISQLCALTQHRASCGSHSAFKQK
jgi:hypothetical protein